MKVLLCPGTDLRRGKSYFLGMTQARALAFALLALACQFGFSGCPESECVGSDDPSIALGQGVGGAFLPLENEQLVTLDVAPQGGFGVKTLISTLGLLAGDVELANVQLNVEADGELAGEFLLEDARLLCRSSEEGGLVSEVVVGFDPDIYETPDDLLSLDGQVVDLDVTVTDAEGNSASVVQSVTVSTGG